MPNWTKVAVLVCLSRLLLSILTVLALAGCGGGSDARPAESNTIQVVSPPPNPRATPDQVLTASPLGDLVYRPASINEGDGYSIDHIRWRRYGGHTAIGTAVRSSDGKRVTIRLRGIYDCAGGPAYLTWSVAAAGEPNGFSDIMSPHEWNETCYPEPEYEGPYPISP